MPHKFTTAREIAELNIDHYRKLLQTRLDEQTRGTVEQLLNAELKKLATLGQENDGKRS